MTAAFEVWFCCDACDLPTPATHNDDLLLCASCAAEADVADMLDRCADAVDAAGDRLDVELWALADSVRGLPDAGAL